jgi:peptidoglycan hydrolase-like protein with peptidoglycan-binding domain
LNDLPILLPTIPETIVVHLGDKDEEAPNVEVGFIDYIANVASREIYPTWPQNALVANVIAQSTFALNRVYTEYYRSRGYDFDITSTGSMDQTYDPGGSVFENLEQITEEYFNSYIRRAGNVEPLYAVYCDGIRTACDGLSQTGSVQLASSGLSPIEILKYYYGEDIEFVSNVSISTPQDTAPSVPLRLGSSGNSVFILQRRLNRISANYPSIPKIPLEDGVFGTETENAVKEFQRVFGLTVDGIVGDATWYEVREKYNAVKKLNELLSEGLNYEDVTLQFPENLSFGDRGVYVSIIQYYLNFVSAFTTEFSDVPIDGIFDEETVELVKDFQAYAGLPQSGIMDEVTWNALFDEYRGIILSLPPSSFEGVARPFPGIILRLGSEGQDVFDLQGYINVLATVYDRIPEIAVDGIFGPQTRDAVYALQDLFDLTVDGSVDSLTWAKIADEYNTIVAGKERADDQFPGYTVS